MIATTPATDTKSVMNRVVEVPVSELTGDQAKYYMRMGLKTKESSGEGITTRFHTFFCVEEYVMRMARKGLGKVTVFTDVETKDKWVLQMSVMAVLNRRANANIKKKVSELIINLMKSKAKDMSHGDMVKAVMAGVFQMKIKKAASKIYPVRFSEIIKIETLKSA